MKNICSLSKSYAILYNETVRQLEFMGEESSERKNKMQRRIGDNKRT